MTLFDIPFSPTFNEYGKKIKIDKYASMEKTVHSLFLETAPLIRPKAILKECYLAEKNHDSVILEGYTFTSAVLRKNFDPVERVFAYVATCGNELEDFCKLYDFDVRIA